jgi:hypothetical protein
VPHFCDAAVGLRFEKVKFLGCREEDERKRRKCDEDRREREKRRGDVLDVSGNSRLVSFCVQLHPAVALMISSNWVGQEVGERKKICRRGGYRVLLRGGIPTRRCVIHLVLRSLPRRLLL